jgi:hypothetical protein
MYVYEKGWMAFLIKAVIFKASDLIFSGSH